MFWPDFRNTAQKVAMVRAQVSVDLCWENIQCIAGSLV
jgi:hypothetical protein